MEVSFKPWHGLKTLSFKLTPCFFSLLFFAVNPQVQAFYGGRMTNDRLLAVKNATSEAIDHLHNSLESCPDAEAESPDPRGIKVPPLPLSIKNIYLFIVHV